MNKDTLHGQPNNKVTIPIKKVINILIFITALIFFFHIAAATLSTKIGYGFIPGDNLFCRLFDMDMESNIPTWFQSAILLLTSGLALWTALTYQKNNKIKHFWYFVSAVLLFLSIDETSMLHERIRLPAGLKLSFGSLSIPAHFTWIIPGIVAVLIVGIIIIKPLLMLDKATRNRLMLAGAIYVTGALGVEIITASTWETLGQFRTFQYSLLAGVEELAEFSGSIICLRAILILLSDRKTIINVDR